MKIQLSNIPQVMSILLSIFSSGYWPKAHCFKNKKYLWDFAKSFARSPHPHGLLGLRTFPKWPVFSLCTHSASKQKDCHTGWLRSIWMQRIGSEGSHGSNLVWRPLKAVGATLRALPFKHRFFCCRENNPQHRYNIKVAKHNTERLNFKSGYLHLEVNECQQWCSMFMLRLCVLVCVCLCVLLRRFLHFREVVLWYSRSNLLHILSKLSHWSLFPNQNTECHGCFC